MLTKIHRSPLLTGPTQITAKGASHEWENASVIDDNWKVRSMKLCSYW